MNEPSLCNWFGFCDFEQKAKCNNNMFFVSGGLQQKRMINTLPDLSDLQEGDLKYKIDFKNVYATVLNKWLNADDKKILGKEFDYLNFI